jgi:L-ascorbate metabolism protein UlaG (beta-lactamase superfamily)
MCEICASRQPSSIGRRRLITGAVLAGAASQLPLPRNTGIASATEADAAQRDAGSGRQWGVHLRWFGTAAWEVTWQQRRVLLDPWLTRFRTADPQGVFDPTTPISVGPEIIDTHLTDAELICATHGHWDHIADIPYLAQKMPAARILCTETTAQLLVAMGVQPDRLVHVSGGERLNFDGIVVNVIASLHSRSGNGGYFAPGLRNSPPEAPAVISDLVAGETVSYQFELPDGPKLYWSGATDFNASTLRGFRPDIAIISMTSTLRIDRYLERLLETLGKPRVVIPNHHDDLQTPLGVTVINPDSISEFRDVVRRVSPRSRLIEPSHLDPIEL